jgi:UMF1 family MFS transporter
VQGESDIKLDKRKRRRALIAWSLYDWANSPFPTVIVTFVFASYFTQAVAATPEQGTAQWGTAMAISAIVIAIISPITGAAADKGGRRKPWLAGFTALCVVSTAMLWFTGPAPDHVVWALVFFSLANLGFEVATVFYNAMLPELAPESHIGRWSGWGWGLGYAGGLVCLAIALFAFVQADPPPFGLDRAEAGHVRAVAPLVAVWFAVFAIPIFLFTPDRRSGLPLGRAVREGVVEAVSTVRHIGRYPNIARFIVARLFYTDGMNTLFAFGGIYAAGAFGMDTAEIIMFGIALNVTAGLGAAGFAWIDDLFGAKRTVLIGLCGLIAFGLPMLLVTDKTVFWILGLGMATFMGPSQTASRSLMARIAPREAVNEMFGLFALSGKITSFLNPLVLAWATLHFQSQRAGMATVVIFMALGALLLLPVKEIPQR